MKKILGVVFLSFLLSGALRAGDAGSTGLAFLKIPIDARSTGMGEASTALASGAAATYWNPAGLSLASSSEVLFNHTEWVQGIRGEFAALALKQGTGVWGFHVYSLNIGDIAVRSTPTPVPLEKTSANYLSLGISYARRWKGNFSLGVTLKYLYEKIFIETANGLAADFGASYRLPFYESQVALVVQNVGKMNRFRTDETRLPTLARLGFFLPVPFRISAFAANVVLDLVKPLEEALETRVGAEVLLFRHLAVRGGWLSGTAARNWTVGLGFIRSGIRLDYSLSPFNNDLGNGHRFSVSFNL